MERALAAVRPKDLPSGVIDLEGDSPGVARAVKDRDDGSRRSSSPLARENASGASGFGSREEARPEPRLFGGHPQKRLQGIAGQQDPNRCPSSLDRELEVEMVNYLRCQNQELREEVELLTKHIKGGDSMVGSELWCTRATTSAKVSKNIHQGGGAVHAAGHEGTTRTSAT